MRAQNRHDTLKWKKKRKHRFGDKCNVPQCMICHANKVTKVPDRQVRRANEKLKVEEGE